MLALGVYAAVWLAFYIVPLTALTLQGLGELVGDLPRILRELFDALSSPDWWRNLLEAWRMIPLIVLGTILGLYTATLLVALPVAVTVIYARAWLRAWRATARGGIGRPLAVAVPALVLVLAVSLVLIANRQPQRQAFDLLAQPPASPVEAEALLDQQQTIRKGLLNAYLAPQRYISAVGEVRHVRDLYKEAFKLPVDQAVRVQNLYEGLARPLLYESVNPSKPTADWDHQALQREPREAAELYESFFDESIVDGEHDAVVRAIRSNWNVEQATTAWQAIDDREVRLVQQDVTVAEHGDWAEVELHEEYQNVTGMRQEVVYYFSLPESAVVTGLWLGNSDDRDAASAYRVSPRGAAQAAYRNEVRRQIDPALVEQIGPRQYRLRIFPVEPQTDDLGTERSAVASRRRAAAAYVDDLPHAGGRQRLAAAADEREAERFLGRPDLCVRSTVSPWTWRTTPTTSGYPQVWTLPIYQFPNLPTASTSPAARRSLPDRWIPLECLACSGSDWPATCGWPWCWTDRVAWPSNRMRSRRRSSGCEIWLTPARRSMFI